MIDFTKFDNQIDTKALEEQMKNAAENNFEPLPEGEYQTTLDKLEVKETKDHKKLMLTATYRVQEGEHRNKCIFQNQTIFGTKNDGFGIHMAKQLIEHLGFEAPEFQNYSQFAEEVDEIAQDAVGEDYVVTITQDGQYQRFSVR